MRLQVFLSAMALVVLMSVAFIVVGGATDLVTAMVARRRRKVVDKISVLLFESEDAAAAIFGEVADLPRRTLISLIQTLAVDLDGHAHRRLQDLAAATGLQRSIRRRTRSRRWRIRVQAAQLNYLVTHPDFDREALLRDRHPLVRARAAEVLTREQAVEHLPNLISLLDDESIAARLAAQTALVTAGAAAVPRLLAWLTRDGPSSVAVLEVAALMSDSRLTDAIETFTRGDDPTVRAMACHALGNGVGSECVPILDRMVGDPVAEVRASAIEALGRVGAVGSVCRVGAQMSDRSFFVRRASGLALDSLGPPGRLILRRHLGDADPYARDMARQILDASAARLGLDLVPSIRSIEDAGPYRDFSTEPSQEKEEPVA